MKFLAVLVIALAVGSISAFPGDVDTKTDSVFDRDQKDKVDHEIRHDERDSYTFDKRQLDEVERMSKKRTKDCAEFKDVIKGAHEILATLLKKIKCDLINSLENVLEKMFYIIYELLDMLENPDKCKNLLTAVNEILEKLLCTVYKLFALVHGLLAFIGCFKNIQHLVGELKFVLYGVVRVFKCVLHKAASLLLNVDCKLLKKLLKAINGLFCTVENLVDNVLDLVGNLLTTVIGIVIKSKDCLKDISPKCMEKCEC